MAENDALTDRWMPRAGILTRRHRAAETLQEEKRLEREHGESSSKEKGGSDRR